MLCVCVVERSHLITLHTTRLRGLDEISRSISVLRANLTGETPTSLEQARKSKLVLEVCSKVESMIRSHQPPPTSTITTIISHGLTLARDDRSGHHTNCLNLLAVDAIAYKDKYESINKSQNNGARKLSVHISVEGLGVTAPSTRPSVAQREERSER